MRWSRLKQLAQLEVNMKRQTLMLISKKRAKAKEVVANVVGAAKVWIAKMSRSGRLQLVMLNPNHAEICVA